ncbi:MAG: hypothetical protein CMJ25_31575 [Phycisphaerae bacterium]|nr:hypothetical protein [Phycisphaerae bacterium]
MPNINTLVEDIYSVIEGKGGWDKTITEYLATNIAQTAEAKIQGTSEAQRIFKFILCGFTL